MLPAFHFVLRGVPARAPDSLELRLGGAACSLVAAIALLLVPGLRRYLCQVQLFNLLPALFVVLALIVNSGNNFYYVASGLLVIVGLQQAFFRVRDLVTGFFLGILFHVAYSAHAGLLGDRTNTLVIAIFCAGYLIALLPAVVSIRTRETAIAMRYAAEHARCELAVQLARQTIVSNVVEFIGSTFDLQDVLDNVARALGPHVNGERACVALWDSRACAMIVKSEYRRDPLRVPSILHTELKSHHWSSYYRRMAAGRAIHVRDVARAQDIGASQNDFLRLAGTKELLVVPITAHNRRRLLGFIGLAGTSTPGTITGDDVTILESVAGQVAIAIQQSRVYEQLQEEVAYRKGQEVRLSDLANRDPLTGIFNRRYFVEELKRRVESKPEGQPRGALFFMDLDRFKIVNDTLGHDAGDRVLLAIPKIMRTALRESDLLARMGGDEFVVLLADIKPAETLRVAEKIRKCIAGYAFHESGRTFDLGVSIGVAVIDGVVSAQELIRRADEACYRAKAAGRNLIELWTGSDSG